MSWFTEFFISSIGRKLIMSLTGLFLISFLLVHLVGNLQLLAGDGGQAFNIYAKFMTTNPIIKTTSYLLYASILLHAIQGIILWRKNRQARGSQEYAIKAVRVANTNATAAVNMAWLGIIIFVFICIHMYQFWLQMKLGLVPMITYEGEEYKDLYAITSEAFANPLYVAFYVASMAVIGYHLWHGFQSSFQTLGLNHRKYTPFIHVVGKLYAVVIPALFALIPVWMFLASR